jgi:hypothetical protein
MDDQERRPEPAEVRKDQGEPQDPGNAPDSGPACRCKEAQGKTITDFIRVMIDDLAFWRKKG